MKKKLFTALAVGSAVFFSSCGTQNVETTAVTTVSETTSFVQATEETTTSRQTETSEESEFEQTLTYLCKGYFKEDSSGSSVPDPDYLPLPDFKEIPANSVFDVMWGTVEGSYMAGTSFLMKMEEQNDPLLITAIHYFGDSILGSDLPGYINGGELYDILKDGSEPDGIVSGVIPIADAVGFGAAETGEKDVAAFTVSDTSGMNSFSPASGTCQPGDMIYLATYLSDENTYYYDDCLYPCVVISDDGTNLYYLLHDMFIATGASGAPLLNKDGEVVGIHIASANSVRYGHSIQSICEQLETALEGQ